MTLQQLVGELASEADRIETIEASAPTLTALWDRGVKLLFDRIEGHFLIDHLLSGQIRLTRTPVWNYATRMGRFEVPALLLRVGDRHLSFRPEYRPTAAQLGVIAIEAEPGEAGALLELRLRGDGGWCWMAPVAEKGLRRLLRPLLPRRLVPLDEASFKALLEKVLLGPQPLLTRDGEVLRTRLAAVVDGAGEMRLGERLGSAGALLRRRSSEVATRLHRSHRGMLAGQTRLRLGFGPAALRKGEGGSPD